MPTYQQNKVHIYKYVETHREQINLNSKKWREKHSKLHNKRRRDRYNFEVEWKRLCNILID